MPDELDEWRVVHGSADSILPALLAEPGLTRASGRDDSGSQVGAIVSNLAGPIGVSNVFAHGLATTAAWPNSSLASGAVGPDNQSLDTNAARSGGRDRRRFRADRTPSGLAQARLSRVLRGYHPTIIPNI